MTKESERALAQNALSRAKDLAEKGATPREQLDRAQADFVRASAEYDAARQKVEILTQEVARLGAKVAAQATIFAGVPKRVTLGDVDHSKPPSALDLATGQMILLPPDGSDKEGAEALKNLRMGDVVFTTPDHDVGPVLVFLRGASPDVPDGIVPDMPGLQLPFKVISGPWPKTLTVRMADGTAYTMTVLHADEKNCELEWWPTTATPQAPAAPSGGKP